MFGKQKAGFRPGLFAFAVSAVRQKRYVYFLSASKNQK
jgi:hypothetical protein